MIQIAAALSAGLWLRGIFTDRHDCRMVGSLLFSLAMLCWVLQ
jgi:hypothetical protein